MYERALYAPCKGPCNAKLQQYKSMKCCGFSEILILQYQKLVKECTHFFNSGGWVLLILLYGDFLPQPSLLWDHWLLEPYQRSDSRWAVSLLFSGNTFGVQLCSWNVDESSTSLKVRTSEIGELHKGNRFVWYVYHLIHLSKSSVLPKKFEEGQHLLSSSSQADMWNQPTKRSEDYSIADSKGGLEIHKSVV